MTDAAELADTILSALQRGERGFLILPLNGEAYRIGDEYEIPCVASGLTVSPEHLVDAERHGDALRATAYFAPELVAARYRDRVTDNGVVAVPIEVPLTGCQYIPE